MRNNRLRKIAILLALLFVCALLPLQGDAEDSYAENLSAKCKYGGSISVHKDRLIDEDFESAQRVAKGKYLSIEWSDAVPARSVMLSFYYDPVAYTVTQYDAKGTTLLESEGTLLWNNLFELETDARKIVIRADENDFAICSLYVYGEGTVLDYHPFEQTPEKADYMLIAMHPDDDVLFLGAIIPTYGVQQGYEGIAVYLGTRLRVRRQEALNGAWVMGLRTLPVFGGFPDIPPEYYNKFKSTFTKDDVIRYIVTILRKYRPEVVVSQDLNGEYGHWQHKLLAEGILEAVPLANDGTYQPKGYPKYEPWQVKKLYLHLYPENKIKLNARVPIDGLDGKTAFEVATEAFQCHKSQLPSRHSVQDKGIYSLTDFGLAYTAVGNDTPGVNDMFEHIDPSLLSAVKTPEATETPTDAPVPDLTPELTEEPMVTNDLTNTPETTPEPTAEPTDAAVETQTPAASATIDSPEKQEGGEHADRIILFAGAGLVLLLVVLFVALLLVRKRR